MKASDLFVECLEQEGVKHVFGVPGEEIVDLMDSISRSKIDFITTRHEQGAAFMADVYGRLTGEPGVCAGTLGPGATNLITGIADANLDRAPLVAITGQAGLESMHKESHQYINVIRALYPVTKWNRTITRSEFIPEMVRKAFKISKGNHPGATHLELPEDIAKEYIDSHPLKQHKEGYSNVPDKNSRMHALKLLEESKKPIIIAGNGAIRGKASKELLEFSTKNNIPVVTTFMGKGAISSREELCIGTVGLQSKDYVACGIDSADLIITVGMDIVEYSPRHWNSNKDKKIIHIDTKPSEVDDYYWTEVDLIGDIKQTLNMLITNAGARKDATYPLKLKEHITEELESYKEDDGFPVKPQKIIWDVRQALSDDDILITDVGAHKMWLSRLYPVYVPNTFIVSNGFASMGIALPGAIAAKMVHPKKKVLSVIGDGAFLMNIQELETAKRLGVSFVALVYNDNKYGLIEWKQKEQLGRTYACDIGNPDFVKLAESFGVNGYRAEKAEDLAPLLKKTLGTEGIHIIDVPVDFKENLRLSEKLGKMICPS